MVVFIGMEVIISTVKKARGGDQEAFADIVSLYTPMLQRISYKYSLDFDEVFSELCMSVFRSVKSFDVDQDDVTFGLFARICADRAACDISRKKRKSERLECDPDADVEDIASGADVAGDLIRKEQNEAFKRDARELLSAYEYSVLLKWLNGDKTADIARSLSTSPKSVDNAKARILKKLRDGLCPYDT